MVSVGFLEAAYTNVHMVPPFITQILWATQQFPKYILYKKTSWGSISKALCEGRKKSYSWWLSYASHRLRPSEGHITWRWCVRFGWRWYQMGASQSQQFCCTIPPGASQSYQSRLHQLAYVTHNMRFLLIFCYVPPTIYRPITMERIHPS